MRAPPADTPPDLRAEGVRFRYQPWDWPALKGRSRRPPRPVQASVFDRCGCGNCNSGIQIDWRRFEQFVVNPDLDLKPVLVGAQFRMG